MAPTIATAASRPQPHAVVVPYPCSGNINPALQLARLLRRQGVYITFVNTDRNERRMLDAEGAEALAASGLHFETIPDGLSEEERATQVYGISLSVATSTRCAAPLRELLARLNATPDVPPVTCVVPTAFMSFALDVAAELGIPSMVLWGCSAGALLGHIKLRELRELGCIPIKDADALKAKIDWISGLPAMPLGDFSGFLRNLDDPDNFGLRFNETEANNCVKAGALILNTFEDLEPGTLAELSGIFNRIYPIGPLGSLLRAGNDNNDDSTTTLSLWKKDDASCLTWLDAQEPGSVVYVSFGSHAVLTPAQVTELAWGLAASGQPFLWAVREDLVFGSRGGDGEDAVTAVLPPEFFTGGETRCYLTTWCAQEEVLRHRAVGCFLTHGGWNSTCEGIAAGVPMVFWPGFADQYTNATLACEQWYVGARLADKLTRQDVTARVREVMHQAAPAGEEIANHAAKWKGKADKAVGPGGSSHGNMKIMVEAMVKDAGPVDDYQADKFSPCTCTIL